MTDKQTPPDWVLIEAAKRSGWFDCSASYVRSDYWASDNKAFRALCDMIKRYEQPPVDRKVLCARAAKAQLEQEQCNSGSPGYVDISVVDACVRAIELWESGYGA